MATSFTAYATPVVNPVEKITPQQILLKKITDLKIKDLQKLTGRKFTLKEKIGFGILKLKLKQQLKHTPADGSKKGETALIFGIGSLAILFLATVVPGALFASFIAAIIAIILGGSARKKDPSDKKAKTAKLLGWITLGLIAALMIVIFIALSNWSWGWG
ncbi:MAG: hypothetical protein HOP10_07670 [Chitinophagaceae bacterium]|nr:hypothetical protein [Chitinophagaceae bacterium]